MDIKSVAEDIDGWKLCWSNMDVTLDDSRRDLDGGETSVVSRRNDGMSSPKGGRCSSSMNLASLRQEVTRVFFHGHCSLYAFVLAYIDQLQKELS